MSVIERKGGWGTRYEVRWRQDGRHRARRFARLVDAEVFDAEVRRRRELGALAALTGEARAPLARASVYFVRGADKVKVGIAVDPELRLANLRLECPVPLALVRVVAAPHARTLERALHRRWAEHRSHGEWFDAAPVLADLDGASDDDVLAWYAG